MMLKLTILAALVAAAAAQPPCPPVPAGGCSVCGEGRCITNKTAIFAFPGQTATPCETLQFAGEAGLITAAECPFLPPLIGVCECAEPPPPTAAPVAPTNAPVAPTTPPGECPGVPEGACNVCGDLGCVQEEEPIFSFPGQPSASCGALQAAGFVGNITAQQCPFLPPLITTLCGCGQPGTDAPVTAAPVPPPTDAPVAPPPTDAPVAPPTEAPVPPPTDAPIATEAPVPTAPTPFPVFILTPQPTPTDELESDEENDGGMGMGMGMGGMGMGMGDDSDDGMSMAMKKRRLAGIRSGNSAARRGGN